LDSNHALFIGSKEEAEECTEPKIKRRCSEFIFRELSLDELKIASGKGIDKF